MSEDVTKKSEEEKVEAVEVAETKEARAKVEANVENGEVEKEIDGKKYIEVYKKGILKQRRKK